METSSHPSLLSITIIRNARTWETSHQWRKVAVLLNTGRSPSHFAPTDTASLLNTDELECGYVLHGCEESTQCSPCHPSAHNNRVASISDLSPSDLNNFLMVSPHHFANWWAKTQCQLVADYFYHSCLCWVTALLNSHGFGQCCHLFLPLFSLRTKMYLTPCYNLSVYG